MDYTEYKICTTDPENADIIVAELSDLGFESFTQYDPETGSICGYITQVENQIHRLDIEAYLRSTGYVFEEKVIPAQDWNSLWESNFEPVTVSGCCHIRAPFHEPTGAQYEIVIMPKMSFGTGHHATTHLMVEAILAEDFSGLSGVDMGSGTGILAILAAQRGAVTVDAIDIDEWAYENCVENIRTNGAELAVCPILSDASVLEGRLYDFVLANINRNILLADMDRYAASLRGGGFIILSGILEGDVSDISACAAQAGLDPVKVSIRDGWASVKAVKSC